MNIFSRRAAEGSAADPAIPRDAVSAMGIAPNAAQRAAVATTAWLLDQLAFRDFGGNGTEGPLRSALGTDRSPLLARALASLNDAQRTLLRSRVPEASLQKLIALSRETNPRFFASGLLDWAAGHPDVAGLVCGLFAERGPDGKPLLPGANEELCHRAAAMLGQGPFTDQLGFLLKRGVHEASDPVGIVGMGWMGFTAFTTARTVFLSHLLSLRNLATAGFKASTLASAGAFLIEVPAVWGASKGLREVLNPGHQAWDLGTNFRELVGLALTLAPWKISGAAAAGLSRRLAGASHVAELASLQRLGQGVLRQGVTLGGIYLGRRLEVASGLRRDAENATPLLDAFSTLAVSYVGGGISQELMGSRVRGYIHGLELRSRLMEQSAVATQGGAWERWGDFFRNGGPQGGAVAEALAGAAGGRVPGRAAQEDGRFGIRSGISKMVIDADKASASDIGYLPHRTGMKKNNLGDIAVDGLEPHLSPEKLIQRLPPGIQSELLAKVRKSNGLEEPQIPQLNKKKFGNNLAKALQRQIDEVQKSKVAASLAEDDPKLQEALRVAGELVGIVEYLRRSNDREVILGFNAVFDHDQEFYEPLKILLREYLGPKFMEPKRWRAEGDEVVQPDQAVLAIGSGAMTSLLALLRHNIRPDGLPWWTRLFATTRDQRVADDFNERGVSDESRSLRGIRINYSQDPPIEVVGPDRPYRGLTQERLRRTVRLQILNVPSDQLHHVLTPEYVQGLPENAILFEVIGGFISRENMSDYETEAGKRQALLPYELINLALRKYGRGDVSVVSGGGYIPSKSLWRGEPVKMVFAGPAEAADLVARTFAGARYENDFLEAFVTVEQRSTELGKGMKNVATLADGYEAVPLAIQHLENGALDDAGLASLQQRYESGVREPWFRAMQGLLVHNEVGIHPEYHPVVKNDYWKCSDINMAEVVKIITEVRILGDPEVLDNFILARVVNNSRIAPTRNPRWGVAWGLRRMWHTMQKIPLSHESNGKLPKVEGFKSLGPMAVYYDHDGHPVERQRVGDRFYDIYDEFHPGQAIVRPPKVPDHIRDILQGKIPKLQGLAPTLRLVLSKFKDPNDWIFFNSELDRLKRSEQSGQLPPWFKLRPR